MTPNANKRTYPLPPALPASKRKPVIAFQWFFGGYDIPFAYDTLCTLSKSNSTAPAVLVHPDGLHRDARKNP